MDLYKNNILRPTAAVQFDNTPSLKFKYGSYDLYVDDIYRRNKHKWIFGGSVISHTEEKHSSLSDETIPNKPFVDIVIDDIQAEEVESLIKKNSESYTPNVSNTKTVNTSENEVEVKRIKPKKAKALGNNRVVNTTCPYCLSKLVLDEFGLLNCSGDKLQIWEEEFVKYEKLDETKRKEYLKKYSDQSIFLDLFDRYVYTDEAGYRQKLVCVYSNRLGNPISRFTTNMYDPCFVATIERSLGRPLTEEEKAGEVEIWKEGKAFFIDYKKGRQKVKIPCLVYPDNFI